MGGMLANLKSAPSWLTLLYVFAVVASSGNCALSQDRPDNCKTISCYTRFINSGRLTEFDLAFTYYLRGSSQAEKSNYEAAISDYNQALRHFSDRDNGLRGRVFLSLGRAYEALGDIDRAIAAYNDGLSDSDPANDTADIHLARGKAYLRKKEFEKAKADFNESLDIFPMDSAREALALANSEQRKARQAEV